MNRPVAGSIEVFGQDILRLPPDERRKVEQRWGILFQNGALFSSLTVGAEYPGAVEGASRPEGPDARRDCGPEDRAGRPAAGSRGRNIRPNCRAACASAPALARALALDPEIVFLDEPTAGLDPIGAADFDQLIADLRDTIGFTVFLVTHDLDTLATVCDRIAVLGQKRVMVAGTMAEMLEQTDPWIVEYFHGPRGRAAMDAKARNEARQRD